MAIGVTRIDSVASYVAEVARIEEDWTPRDGIVNLWFRGQADTRWGLTPGLYRARNPDEDQMRWDFKRRAVPYIQRAIGSDWEWYFTMQHYGIPTRLLDWTAASLLALYFAVRANTRRTAAAVWMLDPWWLNKVVIGSQEIVFPEETHASKYLPPIYSDVDLPDNPVAILPPHSDRRIAAQQSCFTVFGSEPGGLEHLAVRRKSARLFKIEVDSTQFAKIRSDLITCGISETSVYPDLEGLSRELREWWGR
jgi:FRG domain